MADACNDVTDILLIDGTCQKCADYSHPDAALRTCITDTCYDLAQYLALDGTCQYCPDF
jgi:hypothetical protein